MKLTSEQIVAAFQSGLFTKEEARKLLLNEGETECIKQELTLPFKTQPFMLQQQQHVVVMHHHNPPHQVTTSFLLEVPRTSPCHLTR